MLVRRGPYRGHGDPEFEGGGRDLFQSRPWTSTFRPRTIPRRVEVRRWFTEHPAPTPAELVDAGYVVPHWPGRTGSTPSPSCSSSSRTRCGAPA